MFLPNYGRPEGTKLRRSGVCEEEWSFVRRSGVLRGGVESGVGEELSR
jgi:hypothetical protein